MAGMDNTPEAVLAWAVTKLGITEWPPESNRVEFWDDIHLSGDQGQPWCAAFVQAAYLANGVQLISKSVYVPQLINDYYKAGRLHPIADARPGDQVLYRGVDFPEGHTGIVESIDHDAKTVTAIEGNTSSGPGGSQWNGGGVYRRVRPWSDVAGVGRPDFVTNTTHIAEEAAMAMIVLDPKGPDDLGRDSHWEFDKQGNVFAWNGARPLKTLKDFNVTLPAPVVAAVLDPSGDAVVLFCDDAHQDERQHWVRSTYKLPVA